LRRCSCASTRRPSSPRRLRPAPSSTKATCRARRSLGASLRPAAPSAGTSSGTGSGARQRCMSSIQN
jgi:hypothetical protein